MKKLCVVFLAGLLVAALFVVPGCGEKAEEGETTESVELSAAEIEQVEGLGRSFDFNVFKQVVEEDAEGGNPGNVFISPESLRIALMMAYNGAAGDTSEAMAGVLGVEELSLEEANQRMSTLLKVLQSAGEGALVEIADSLWGKKGLEFKQDFIERNKEYYDAEVREITTAGEINDWVDEKTHGKITEIVDDIDPLTIMFLINAIYFKGAWSEPFDASLTEERDFTLQDGTKKKVPLMSQSGEYRYMENDLFQAVELPYGEEGKVSMYVLLPKEGLDLGRFVDELDGESWDGWMNEMSKREGDVSIPKFTMEYEKQLNSALQALGMEVAFDPEKADFSNMISTDDLGENVYISNVLQKTFVDVNEEGTEAAAVTSVEMAMTAAPVEEERFQMVVDRPFFLTIRNNETGTLLFMGLIVDPG